MSKSHGRRRCLIALATTLAFWSGAAFGQSAAPENPKLAAYRYAVRCFYANGRMMGTLERRGETAKAAVYRGNSERSHRGAVTLGRAAGLTDGQMAKDLDAYRSSFDLAHMMTDAAYFDEVVAGCKAIGLM